MNGKLTYGAAIDYSAPITCFIRGIRHTSISDDRDDDYNQEISNNPTNILRQKEKRTFLIHDSLLKITI